MLDSHYEHINNLVREVKAGAGDALVDLAHFYRPLMQRAFRRCFLREPRLRLHREDVEADALVVLHDLVQDYDPSLSYFSYFLSTRFDHALLSRSRRFCLGLSQTGNGIEEVNFSEMPDDWEPEAPADPFGRIEDVEMLRQAIQKLTSQQREAIDLYYYQNCNQQQAALRLGIEQSSFSKRLLRAQARLRVLLAETL